MQNLSKQVTKLKIKIFADGAEQAGMVALLNNPVVKGFTTNPSLMRKAGINDYEKFARELLTKIPDHPISFEVFADELAAMEAQAKVIASWGKNVYVKIPVTNTKGDFTGPIISKLSKAGIALNVTAILTLQQVQQVTAVLDVNTPAVISVFAGRIADTGVDPLPLMQESVAIMRSKPKAELLWASPREILNIFQAETIGCHIITVTYDMLKKLSLVGKDLKQYSLETVQMFYEDAKQAGYKIRLPATEASLV